MALSHQPWDAAQPGSAGRGAACRPAARTHASRSVEDDPSTQASSMPSGREDARCGFPRLCGAPHSRGRPRARINGPAEPPSRTAAPATSPRRSSRCRGATASSRATPASWRSRPAKERSAPARRASCAACRSCSPGTGTGWACTNRPPTRLSWRCRRRASHQTCTALPHQPRAAPVPPVRSSPPEPAGPDVPRRPSPGHRNASRPTRPRLRCSTCSPSNAPRVASARRGRRGRRARRPPPYAAAGRHRARPHRRQP